MKAIPLAIPDVILLEPKVFGDDRGFFLESFSQAKFETALSESKLLEAIWELERKRLQFVTVWSFIDVLSLPSNLQMSRQNAKAIRDTLMLTDS